MHFPYGHFLQIHNSLCIILKQNTFPGKRYIFFIPDKKLLSNLLFKLRNPVGDCGLGNVEEAGSLSEVFYIGKGEKGSKILSVHVRFLSVSFLRVAIRADVT